DGPRYLLDKLFLIRPDPSAYLLQSRHIFPLDHEHSFSRRQENPWRHLEACIHIHDCFNSLSLLLRVDLLGECIFLALFCRLGLRRRIPIHHGGRDLFPIASFSAVIADPFPASLIASDQLKRSVLQNELLSPRQHWHSRLRLLVGALRRGGGLLLLGRGTAWGLAVGSRAHARQKSDAIDWSAVLGRSRHSALPYGVRCL